jgi:hypothetical protein
MFIASGWTDVLHRGKRITLSTSDNKAGMTLANALATILVATLLAGINAAAIEPTGGDVFEARHFESSLQVGKQLSADTQQDVMVTEDPYLISRLDEISDHKFHLHNSTQNTVALSRTLNLKAFNSIKTKSVNVRDIARTLCKSDTLLKQYVNLDPEADRLKTAIKESNKVYAAGLLAVAAHIENPASPDGQAIANLLWLGRENASCQAQIDQVYSSLKLMRELTKEWISNGNRHPVEDFFKSSVAAVWPSLNEIEREKVVTDLIGFYPS